jgi:hypothetical protein
MKFEAANTYIELPMCLVLFGLLTIPTFLSHPQMWGVNACRKLAESPLSCFCFFFPPS